MLWELVKAGLLALEDYIALHVLTCLVPAFLLAGAMVTFVSREAIIHHLGAATRKLRAFALAAGGSFFVAACSCTVIPVSSGLYYAGAAVGAAFVLLWVAPAANILALVYTGSVLGAEMVIVRVVAALAMAFVVGWVMTLVFRAEEARRVPADPDPVASAGEAAAPAGRLMGREDLVVLGLLVVTLLAPNYVVQRGPYWAKALVWLAATAVTAGYVLRVKSREDIRRWLSETWWFVRIIFPLLLGGSSLRASFVATMIGSVSYFATMTEAPFVDTLMRRGMGKGPALALLLTGPGLSLPNWLAIGRVFGAKKAVVYVATIMVLGTLVGWVAGHTVL